MYEKSFTVEFVAPDRVVYRGPATSISAPGVEGGFQVLYNHAPLLALMEPGLLKLRDVEGHETLYAVGGGVVEVRDNRVRVLADSAEASSDINIERAKAARQRAEQRLQNRGHDVDEIRARLALARALNRLRVASRA